MLALYISLGCVGLAGLVIAFILLGKRVQVVRLEKTDLWLLDRFNEGSVLVFGLRGAGKDVVFSHVINLIGGEHYSNIEYNADTEIINASELSAGGNTFENIVSGDIRPFPPRFGEGVHIFISDAGIYFPCQYDKKLDNLYPSLSVFLAVERHLHNAYAHFNCQAVDRVYKKIREQMSYFIECCGTIRRGEYLYTKIIGYRRESDAVNGNNADIKLTIRSSVYEHSYDSRYFRRLFYGEPYSPLEKILNNSTKGVLPSCTTINRLSGLNDL